MELHLEKRMHNETSDEFKKQINSIDKEKELLIANEEQMSKELDQTKEELEKVSKQLEKTTTECDARVLDVGTQLKIVEENYKAINAKCDELQNSTEAIKVSFMEVVTYF